MPDDNYRPTHGLPPDSRPTNVPPEWWSLLDRNDLPKGGGELDDGRSHRRGRDEDIIHALRGRHAPHRAPRRYAWVTNLALLAIAALLLVAGLGNTTPKGIALILIVVGVLTLLTAVVIQVARAALRRR
jgi:hypothetical protein